MEQADDLIFTFGAKKGKPVYKVNSNYLRWATEQDGLWDKYPDLMERAEEELNMRDDERSHFYEDAI